jgi:hypothetical protein
MRGKRGGYALEKADPDTATGGWDEGEKGEKRERWEVFL